MELPERSLGSQPRPPVLRPGPGLSDTLEDGGFHHHAPITKGTLVGDFHSLNVLNLKDSEVVIEM